MRLPSWNELETTFALFGLTAVAAIGVGFIWALATEPGYVLPRDLKTFKQMKSAFRRGKNRPGNARVSAIYAMKDYAAKSTDAAGREEIAGLMRGGIAEYMRAPSFRMDSEVWCMLETLAAAAPEWEAGFLEEVIGSEVTARNRAIDRLVELRGTGCLEFLTGAAGRAEIAPNIADAIATLGRAAAKPFVIDALRAMLGDTQNPLTPPAAARALIALGLSSDPAIAQQAEKFDPWTAFAYRAKIAGLDAPALAEKLFSSGIVGEDRRHLVTFQSIREMQEALDRGLGFEAVEQFLEKLRSVYSFDTEWDPEPDYCALLAELSEVSAPRVAIERAVVLCRGDRITLRNNSI